MVQTVAGQISIDLVQITNAKGTKVDITDLVLEVNVYEDIFSPVMSGNIVVVDAVGLLNSLPIVGQEKIKIQITSPMWNTVKFEFHSYSVTERQADNKTTTSYLVNFISKEAIDDKITRISKSYRGTQAMIAKTVFKDWISSTKNFSVENTSHNTSFIVPYWSPFETINYLASRSMPNIPGPMASMVFYENQSGFRFESIQSMFKQESLGELKSRDSNIQSSTNVKSKIGYAGLTIEDYEVLELPDTLKSMSNGMLGTTLYSKDLTKNSWTKKDWNYLVEAPASLHLNKNLLIPETNAFGYKFKNVVNEARFTYTHDKIFTDIVDNFFPKEWVGSRISLLQQLNSTRLNISVPGHILFSAGKLINLTFPNNAPVTSKNAGTDPFLTGKYLITSVRHNFQIKFHRVTAECVKESIDGVEI
jgi:hypothetical protein